MFPQQPGQSPGFGRSFMMRRLMRQRQQGATPGQPQAPQQPSGTPGGVSAITGQPQQPPAAPQAAPKPASAPAPATPSAAGPSQFGASLGVAKPAAPPSGAPAPSQPRPALNLADSTSMWGSYQKQNDPQARAKALQDAQDKINAQRQQYEQQYGQQYWQLKQQRDQLINGGGNAMDTGAANAAINALNAQLQKLESDKQAKFAQFDKQAEAEQQRQYAPYDATQQYLGNLGNEQVKSFVGTLSPEVQQQYAQAQKQLQDFQQRYGGMTPLQQAQAGAEFFQAQQQNAQMYDALGKTINSAWQQQQPSPPKMPTMGGNFDPTGRSMDPSNWLAPGSTGYTGQQLADYTAKYNAAMQQHGTQPPATGSRYDPNQPPPATDGTPISDLQNQAATLLQRLRNGEITSQEYANQVNVLQARYNQAGGTSTPTPVAQPTQDHAAPPVPPSPQSGIGGGHGFNPMLPPPGSPYTPPTAPTGGTSLVAGDQVGQKQPAGAPQEQMAQYQSSITQAKSQLDAVVQAMNSGQIPYAQGVEQWKAAKAAVDQATQQYQQYAVPVAMQALGLQEAPHSTPTPGYSYMYLPGGVADWIPNDKIIGWYQQMQSNQTPPSGATPLTPDQIRQVQQANSGVTSNGTAYIGGVPTGIQQFPGQSYPVPQQDAPAGYSWYSDGNDGYAMYPTQTTTPTTPTGVRGRPAIDPLPPTTGSPPPASTSPAGSAGPLLGGATPVGASGFAGDTAAAGPVIGQIYSEATMPTGPVPPGYEWTTAGGEVWLARRGTGGARPPLDSSGGTPTPFVAPPTSPGTRIGETTPTGYVWDGSSWVYTPNSGGSAGGATGGTGGTTGTGTTGGGTTGGTAGGTTGGTSGGTSGGGGIVAGSGGGGSYTPPAYPSASGSGSSSGSTNPNYDKNGVRIQPLTGGDAFDTEAWNRLWQEQQAQIKANETPETYLQSYGNQFEDPSTAALRGLPNEAWAAIAKGFAPQDTNIKIAERLNNSTLGAPNVNELDFANVLGDYNPGSSAGVFSNFQKYTDPSQRGLQDSLTSTLQSGMNVKGVSEEIASPQLAQLEQDRDRALGELKQRLAARGVLDSSIADRDIADLEQRFIREKAAILAGAGKEARAQQQSYAGMSASELAGQRGFNLDLGKETAQSMEADYNRRLQALTAEQQAIAQKSGQKVDLDKLRQQAWSETTKDKLSRDLALQGVSTQQATLNEQARQYNQGLGQQYASLGSGLALGTMNQFTDRGAQEQQSMIDRFNARENRRQSLLGLLGLAATKGGATSAASTNITTGGTSSTTQPSLWTSQSNPPPTPVGGWPLGKAPVWTGTVWVDALTGRPYGT